MIRYLLFDLGGVIINIDERITIRELQKLGLDLSKGIFWNPEMAATLHRFEKGEIKATDFYESWRKMGARGADAELEAAWNALLQDIPQHRLALLDQLREKYGLFLLSNINEVHLDAYRAIAADAYGSGDTIEKRFQKVYYSHLIGKRKPDPETFRWICSDAGIPAEETLFLDDGLPNVEGALAAGLMARHVNKDIQELLQDLL